MSHTFRVGAIGYCAVDYLYEHISFSSPEVHSLVSIHPNDGGLIEGGLVFASDVESFTNKPFEKVREELIGKKQADIKNIGGPALVSSLNVHQLVEGKPIEVTYYGCNGDDAIHQDLMKLLSFQSMDVRFQIRKGEDSPYTLVLCDPSANGGNGERSFVVDMGALVRYMPNEIPDGFFSSDICLFGGTALVPSVHDAMHDLLEKSKKHGALTVVGTVFDYRNERRRKGAPWPLGKPNGESYPLIDLLVTDRGEALHLTGKSTAEEAISQFISWGVKACMVTDGANPTLLCASAGGKWKTLEMKTLPVSSYVKRLHGKFDGDTTGCGDNFLGGVVASMAEQSICGKTVLDLEQAYEMGAASGAFACTYHGGAYREKVVGEKRSIIQKIIIDDMKEKEKR